MDPTYDPVGAMTSIKCECCGHPTRVEFGDAPFCENCDDQRQPLLAEIDRLKAELAKFHPCVIQNHRVEGQDCWEVGTTGGHHTPLVWHKDGEQ
jgi:hypothetical protein